MVDHVGSFTEDVRNLPPLVVRDDLVRASGQVVGVRHVVAPAWAWLLREESRDPAWATIEFGPFVIAYRVTL